MLEVPKGEEIPTRSVVKVKDGKSGDAFAFSLAPPTLVVLELGVHQQGDHIVARARLP